MILFLQRLDETRKVKRAEAIHGCLVERLSTESKAGGDSQEVSARQASTAKPTLGKRKSVSGSESLESCTFETPYLPCFIRTTSSITSLSRSGKMPARVLKKLLLVQSWALLLVLTRPYLHARPFVFAELLLSQHLLVVLHCLLLQACSPGCS